MSDPYYSLYREIEQVHNALLALSRQIGMDRTILQRADPREACRLLLGHAGALEGVMNELDEIRFGGPHPFKGQDQLPMQEQGADPPATETGSP